MFAATLAALRRRAPAAAMAATRGSTSSNRLLTSRPGRPGAGRLIPGGRAAFAPLAAVRASAPGATAAASSSAAPPPPAPTPLPKLKDSFLTGNSNVYLVRRKREREREGRELALLFSRDRWHPSMPSQRATLGRPLSLLRLRTTRAHPILSPKPTLHTQEELEERYRADPASVDQSWAAFFRALGTRRRREDGWMRAAAAG